MGWDGIYIPRVLYIEGGGAYVCIYDQLRMKWLQLFVGVWILSERVCGERM